MPVARSPSSFFIFPSLCDETVFCRFYFYFLLQTCPPLSWPRFDVVSNGKISISLVAISPFKAHHKPRPRNRATLHSQTALGTVLSSSPSIALLLSSHDSFWRPSCLLPASAIATFLTPPTQRHSDTATPFTIWLLAKSVLSFLSSPPKTAHAILSAPAEPFLRRLAHSIGSGHSLNSRSPDLPISRSLSPLVACASWLSIPHCQAPINLERPTLLRLVDGRGRSGATVPL